MKGCQFEQKSFAVNSGDRNMVGGKKCFKEDCKNEFEACETCQMIQGKWLFYQPKLLKEQGYAR